MSLQKAICKLLVSQHVAYDQLRGTQEPDFIKR